MTKAELYKAISNAFCSLAPLNITVYDFWISELYTSDGDFTHSKWNEDTLALMESDVALYCS